MLFEQTSYRDDFPIRIAIGDVREYPIHYHQDHEFVVVLKGEIELKNGYCSYRLKEGDVFTNAGHEVHRLYANDKENTVAIIQISTHFFSQYFPELAKACYRTYTNKGKTEKHNALREKLLMIVYSYLVKDFNYKSDCIYMMIDVIKYLDQYFNLFTFEGDMVINFESANQITIDRISRIINYIYRYHAEQISLEDLAELEHLSTFYISHIIKRFTGMNFRDFLCFARVEWSEIDLLESNKKISRIARDVGFSTTAYYEKYFEKWFGCDPKTYRRENSPLVLSDTKRPNIRELNENEVVHRIKKSLSALNSQRPSSSKVSSLKLDTSIKSDAPPLAKIEHFLDIAVTEEDFDVLGYSLFDRLSELKPSKVTLLGCGDGKNGAPSSLFKLIKSAGFEVVSQAGGEGRINLSAGYDSIAYPIYLLSHYMRGKDPHIKARLRDPGDPEVLLKGYPALLCSCGIVKPAYHAVKVLSEVSGDLLLWGRQYCALSCENGGRNTYVIMAYNFNESIDKLCAADRTLHNVKSVLGDFKDELDLSVSMTPERGRYSVLKYSLSHGRDLFSWLSGLGFPEKLPLVSQEPSLMPVAPELETYAEDVRATFSINFSVKGAGIQLAIVVGPN